MIEGSSQVSHDVSSNPSKKSMRQTADVSNPSVGRAISDSPKDQIVKQEVVGEPVQDLCRGALPSCLRRANELDGSLNISDTPTSEPLVSQKCPIASDLQL